MANKTLSVTLRLDDKNYTAKMKGTRQELDRFIKKLKRGDEALLRNEKHVRSWGSGFRDTIIVLGLFQQAMYTINALFLSLPRAIINTNAEMQRMETLLVGLTKSTVSFADAQRQAADDMAFLFSQAKSSPFEVGILTDSFVKLRSTGLDFASEGMNTFRGEADSSRYMLKALTDSVASFGGTSEVFHRASIAIQQMSGKAVISMEELRQQLGEAVPNAAILMARGLGLTMGELTKVVSTGQLEASKGLKSLAAQMMLFNSGAAARMANTFVGLKNQIKTQLQLAALEIGKSGMMDELMARMREFRDFLGSAEFGAWMRKIGEGMEYAFASIPDLINGFKSLYAIMKPLVDLSSQLASTTIDVAKAIAGLIPPLSDANGELTTFGSIVSSAVTYLAGLLIVKKIADALNPFSSGLKGSAGKVAGLAGSAALAVKNIGSLKGVITGAIASLSGWQLVVAASTRSASSMAGIVGSLIKKVGTLAVRLLGWPGLVVAGVAGIVAAYNKWKESTGELTDKQKELESVIASGKEVTEDYYDTVVLSAIQNEEKLAKAIERRMGVTKKRDDDMSRGKAMGFDMSGFGESDDRQSELSEIDAEIKRLEAKGEEYSDALDKMLEQMHRRAMSSSAIDEMAIDVANRVKPVADKIGEEVEAMIEQFAVDGTDVGERIKMVGEKEVEVVEARAKLWREKLSEIRESLAKLNDSDSPESKKKTVELMAQIAAIGTKLAELNRTKELITSGETIGDNLVSGIKVKKASTAISELDARIVKLQARLLGSGTELAKINGLLEKGLVKGTSKQESQLREKAKQADELTEKYKGQKEAIKALEQSEQRLIKLQAARAARAATLTNDNPFLNSVGAASKTISELEARITGLNKAIAKGALSGEDLERAKENIAGMSREIENINLDTLKSAVKEVSEEARDMSEAMMPESERMIAEYNRTLAHIDQIYMLYGDKITKSQSDQIKNYRSMIERQKSLSENGALYAADQWTKGADDFSQAWTTAFDGMASTLADFMVDGEADFASFANSMAKMITQMTIKLLAMQAIQAAMGIGGAVSSGATGTMYGAGSNPLNVNYGGFNVAPNALGGIVGESGPVTLKKYANGGIAYTPQLALFGEGSKPEAYVPLPDGRTIPVTMKQEESGKSGGIGDVTVNVINQSGTEMDAEQGGKRFDGERWVVDVVMREVSRPGRMREAIKGAAR